MSSAVQMQSGYRFQEDEILTLDKLNRLVADAVVRLVANAVRTEHIADRSIPFEKLDVDVQNSLEIQDNSVTTAKIVNQAVTTDKFADESVTAAKIVPGAVTATKLAADAVDTEALADGGIEDRHIAGFQGPRPSLMKWRLWRLGMGFYASVPGLNIVPRPNHIVLHSTRPGHNRTILYGRAGQLPQPTYARVRGKGRSLMIPVRNSANLYRNPQGVAGDTWGQVLTGIVD